MRLASVAVAALMLAAPARAQDVSEQQELQADVAGQLGNLAIAGATLRAQNHRLQADLDKARLALTKLDGITKTRIDELCAALDKAKAPAPGCPSKP